MNRGQWRRWRRILTGLHIVAAIAGLHDYIILIAPTTIVGALALLSSPAIGKHPPESFRFGWLALLFIAGFFILPASTALYGAVGCAACLLLETFYRRVTITLPLILGLLPPVTGYYIGAFSFPIRLQITAMAGRLIGLTGWPVSIAGNSITVRGHAFSVDHACDGLHMLVISLLAALLLINYYQTQYRRVLRPIAVLLLLLIATLFNIIANLFRTICLVVLVILPDNPLHHLLGLFFLVVYIFLPLLPLIRWTIRRWGTPGPEAKTPPAAEPCCWPTSRSPRPSCSSSDSASAHQKPRP